MVCKYSKTTFSRDSKLEVRGSEMGSVVQLTIFPDVGTTAGGVVKNVVNEM